MKRPVAFASSSLHFRSHSFIFKRVDRVDGRCLQSNNTKCFQVELLTYTLPRPASIATSFAPAQTHPFLHAALSAGYKHDDDFE